MSAPAPTPAPAPARSRAWTAAVGLGIAAVLLAAAVVGLLIRTQVSQHRVEVHRAAPVVRLAGQDCVAPACLRDGAPSALLAAVRRAFPVAPADSYSSSDARGRVIAASVRVRLPDEVVVSVLSRCVPGGAAVSPAHLPLEIPSRGPVTAYFLVPGRSGCSVAIVLEVPRGAVVPLAAADDLGRDPQLVLPS